MTHNNTSPMAAPLSRPFPRNQSRPARLLSWLLISAILSAGALQAGTTRTWTGGGTDNTWTNTANWDTGAPVSNDSVLFNGTTRLQPTNNIVNLILNGIDFNSSGFNVVGQAVTNTGGIVDNAGNNTNNLAQVMAVSQSVSNFAGSPFVNAGTINLTNAGVNLSVGGSGTVYLNGVVSGRGMLTLFGDGGTLRLGAANTFSGGVNILSGSTVLVANSGAFPNGAGIGDVTNNGSINLNGTSVTVNGLYGAGTIDNSLSTATGTYTVTVGNNSTNSAGTFTGTINNSYGKIALTKVTTNTFTLNGYCSHTGPTTISAGTLAVGASGVLGSTPSITVAPGALFDISAASSFYLTSAQTLTAGRTTNGGPADIRGPLNTGGASVAIYRPGAAGTLTLSSDLNLSSGGTLSFDLGNTDTLGSGVNDLIALNGTLTFGPATVLFNPLASNFTASPYLLISNATANVSGSASSLTTDLPRGLSVTFDDTTRPGSLYATISGTASPATLVWNGTAGANWDVKISQNWLNGSTADYFYNLDNVVFNDAGNGTVTLLTGVSPTTTTFSNVATNYSLSGLGAISGIGSLTLNGGGTVTNNIANSYTGDTTINNGSVFISGVLAGGPPHITVYNGVAPGNLYLSGGGFYLSDEQNDTYRANFNNLVVGPGAGSVAMRSRASSSSYIIQFNSVSRNGIGGTVDFNNIQSKASSPQVGLLITNTTTVNGILGGGFVTIFATDWVTPVATGAGSTAFAGYQTTTTPTAWTNTANVSLTANPTANLNNTVINSLKLAGSTVTINAGQSLTLASGGLLLPNGGAAATITGGTLLGGTNADLIVHEHSAVNSLTIGSVIVDNTNSAATGGSALTKSGQGTLILAGNNTYTGPTFINGPSLQGPTTGLSATAPGSPTPFPAGSLQLGNGGTSGSIDSSTGVTNNANLAFNRSDAITFALPISGKGAVKVLGGDVTLTGNNSYRGATTISAGTLRVGAGGTAGSLGNSPGVTDNGALVFNRSDDVSYSGPISGTGSLTNQGSGKVTLNRANTYQGRTTISAGTLALGPAATLANSAGISVAAGATFDVSAVSGFTLVAGTVNQSLQGSGVVTGSVTTVSGTSLIPGFSVGTLSFSNNLTIAGGTLQMDVGTSSSDLIVVAGNLALTSGTVQLNLLNTLPNGRYPLIGYGGSLSGTAANLSVAGFSQPGQVAALSSSTPGEVDLVVSTYVGANLVWQGNGTSNPWDVNNTPDWTNSAGAASVFKQFDNANFDDSTTNLAVNLVGALTPAIIGVNAAANNYTLQGSGSLAAGALTKNNTTTLTILTTNGALASTVINSGTVQLGDGTAAGDLGSSAVAVNGSGALVFDEPGDQSSANVFSGNGNITQQGPGALTLVADSSFGGTLTINAGEVVLGTGGSAGSLGTASVTDNGTLLINRSGNLTMSGAISGSGQLIVNGPGTVTLGGANSYQNNTYISNGVVKLSNPAAIPSGGSTTGWLILDGGSTAGTLDLNGFNATVNALSGLTGTVLGQIVNNGGAGTNQLIVEETAATTFAGDILDNSGSGGKVQLVMNGPNTLTLQPGGNGSTYSGGTVINNGVVSGGSSVTANATMCGVGPVIFGANGTLQLAGFTGSTSPDYGTFPNPIIVPANVNATVMGTCRGGGFAPSSVTGPINSSLTFVTRYVRGNVGGNWTAFNGLLIVSNTTASANTDFRMNTATGFPNARMYLAAGGTGGAYMYNLVTGTPIIPIGELSGDASATIALNSGSASGQAALWSVGGLNTSAQYDGGITDTHGIIKVGTGAWTLTSGNLTYTGPTTVSNGVLVFSASAALPPSSVFSIVAPGKLDVSGPGTLSVANVIQGNGNLLGSLSVDGTVIPGFSNAPGVLTVTNVVSLNGTTLINLNRTNSPNSGRLVATNITYGGTLTVTNLGNTLLGGDTFQLFSGALSGAFAATNLPPLAPGLSWDVSKLNSDGRLSVAGQITPPVVGTLEVSGTVNIISGTGGMAGAAFRVLGSTNVVLPLANWTVLGTGTFAADGSYLYTNSAATNSPQFYSVLEVLP